MTLKILNQKRIDELKEAARYANSHGGGYVSVPANDLIALLPPDPEPVSAVNEPEAEKSANPETTKGPELVKAPEEKPAAEIDVAKTASKDAEISASTASKIDPGELFMATGPKIPAELKGTLAGGDGV
jgi:hypothetical protein